MCLSLPERIRTRFGNGGRRVRGTTRLVSAKWAALLHFAVAGRPNPGEEHMRTGPLAGVIAVLVVGGFGHPDSSCRCCPQCVRSSRPGAHCRRGWACPIAGLRFTSEARPTVERPMNVGYRLLGSGALQEFGRSAGLATRDPCDKKDFTQTRSGSSRMWPITGRQIANPGFATSRTCSRGSSRTSEG